MIFPAFILLAYVLFSLSSPLLMELGLTLYAPDLSVVLLLAAATRLTPFSLILYGAFVGLFMDAFTPLSPLGLHMQRCVILAYALRTIIQMFPVHSAPGRIALAMGLTLVSDFTLFVLLAIFDRGFSEYGLIFRRMLPHAMLTGLVAPVVDALMEGAWRWASGKKAGIFYR